MADIYTIVIRNDTSAGGKSYIVFSQQPDIEGGAAPPIKTLVWKRTVPLQKGGQTKFRYSPEFYGFIGTSPVNSASLVVNNSVDLVSSQLVKLDYMINDGTQLFVSKSQELSEIGGKANNGTFQIFLDANLPTPNRCVVGLARQEDDGTPAAVAAVEAKPSVQYSFTPRPAVYIMGGKVDEGRVIDFPAAPAKFGRVEFAGDQREAVVSEQNSGTFTVQYK